jgi:hypothetical protein
LALSLQRQEATATRQTVLRWPLYAKASMQESGMKLGGFVSPNSSYQKAQLQGLYGTANRSVQTIGV